MQWWSLHCLPCCHLSSASLPLPTVIISHWLTRNFLAAPQAESGVIPFRFAAPHVEILLFPSSGKQLQSIWSFLVGDVLQAPRQPCGHPLRRVRPGCAPSRGVIPQTQLPDLQLQLCPCRGDEKGFCPCLASCTLVSTSQHGVCLCLRNTVLPGFTSQARVLPGWICPSFLPDSTISYQLVPALNCTLCFSPSHPTGWGCGPAQRPCCPRLHQWRCRAVPALAPACPVVPGTSCHRACCPSPSCDGFPASFVSRYRKSLFWVTYDEKDIKDIVKSTRKPRYMAFTASLLSVRMVTGWKGK